MTVTKKDLKKNIEHTNVSYTVESFGKKLVELRNENNLTQAGSAEKIGISRNALSMYERFERCPSIVHTYLGHFWKFQFFLQIQLV